MFTATGGEEVAVEAMKHGLDDYIIKNVKHLIRLRGAANAALENAQTRLRAEELAFRLESLLAQLEVGVFSCAVDGRLLEVNTIMRQLIDQAEVGRDEEATLASLFDDPAKAQAFLQQVLASDEAVEVEFAAPSDPSKFFRLSARARNPENKPRHIEGLVEEVTHRKQIEETCRQAAAAAAKLEMLTTREREVVRELVLGSANKVIARRLEISEKTVEKHRAGLMRKLHAKSLAEVVRLALLAEQLPEYDRD
jgi:FixJ family two-component response regulator